MSKKNQVLAAYSASLNMITYGMAFGWPSPSLPILFAEDSPIKVSSSQGSWLSVMPFVGALIGAPLFAVLADRFGRKKIILISTIPFALCWLICGLANTAELLIFARFFSGLAGGANFTALPAYISEITDPDIRGTLGGTITWMWNVGILLIYVCGPFLSVKTMAFISLIGPVVCVATFIWMPESPYFLMMRGNKEEAERILIIFRGYENTDGILSVMEEELKSEGNKNFGSTMLDVCRIPSNRKTLILVIILIIIQEYSGRSSFIFYSEMIFQQVSENFPAYYISMVYAFIQLLASIVATFTVDHFGRKPLLIASSCGVTLCLLAEGVCFYLQEHENYDHIAVKWGAVISLIMFNIVFTIGLGVVPLILAGEIFATNIKNICLGIIDIVSNICGITSGKFFQIVGDKFGHAEVFWSFGAISLAGLVFIVILIPETTKLSLERIQKGLRSRRSMIEPLQRMDRVAVSFTNLLHR